MTMTTEIQEPEPMTKTIALRVDATEYAELAARAERDKVSLSGYIRVRLGLRGEGPADGDRLVVAAGDERDMRAVLADHDRRLDALEADRTAIAAA
jgi:hypothetical protein